MRNEITVILTVLILFGSTTAIAQPTESVSINENEKIGSSYTFQTSDTDKENVTYDGTFTNLEKVNQLNQVGGRVLNVMQDGNLLLVAVKTSSGAKIIKIRKNESFADRSSFALPRTTGEYSGGGSHTVEIYGNGTNTLDSDISAGIIWNRDAGAGESTLWESSDSITAIYNIPNENINNKYGEVAGAGVLKENGTIKVLFEHNKYNGYGQTLTFIWNSETDTVTEISTSTLGTTGLTDYNYEGYSGGSGEYISTSLGKDRSLVIDKSTGNTVSFNNAVIAKHNGQFIIPTSNGIKLYNAENFTSSVLANGYTNTPAERHISNPVGVDKFDQAQFIGNRWMFVDYQTERVYAYNKDLTKIDAAFSDATRSGGTKRIQFYMENETIRFIQGYTSNPAEVTFKNTGLEAVEPKLCGNHLNPPVLENFWETKNVCWIPIFVGLGILNTIYQWLILAILIAMPIASITGNDIATMATINGVLIIAMIIGRMSPGYVAISLLATILLSLYSTGGGDVNVDIGTGEM